VRTRNPSIRPLFGFIIVVALGYNDWVLYQRLMVLRLLETGAQTRLRFERQIYALNHQADLWEAKADILGKKPAKGAKGGPGGESTAGADGASDAQKLASEVRKDLIAAWIDRVYGPFFKKLSLSPADLAHLKALITEKRQATLDAIDAAQAQGITDPAGMRDAILEAVKSVNAETAALLGDDGNASFREYQQSLPARSTVDELSAALPAGSALTPQQSDALVNIIEHGQAPGLRAASIVQNLLTNVPIIVNRNDVAAAGSVLSPVQLSALQSLQDQQVIQRDLVRQLYP